MSYAVVRVHDQEVVSNYSGEAVPGFVVWPDGAASHGVYPGLAHGDWRFVSVIYGPDSPGEFYQITDITPVLSDTALTYRRAWSPIDIATVRATLSSRVDDAAERERVRHITPGSGQAMTYQEKLAQARACVADDAPANEKYPLLAATIGLDGSTLAKVAHCVIERYDQWIVVTAAIESVRREAKASIATARTVDAAVGIYNAITWPG